MKKCLKIYKASAGSGKTFTLAVEYIKLLIENPYCYRNILADDAVVHLKTDSNFMFTYTKYITEVNGLPVVECIDDVHGRPGVSDLLKIRTYYESQWLSRGITIKYIAFNLPAKEQYEEPNVEIELDEYRSYGRSKRSCLETSK